MIGYFLSKDTRLNYRFYFKEIIRQNHYKIHNTLNDTLVVELNTKTKVYKSNNKLPRVWLEYFIKNNYIKM